MFVYASPRKYKTLKVLGKIAEDNIVYLLFVCVCFFCFFFVADSTLKLILFYRENKNLIFHVKFLAGRRFS